MKHLKTYQLFESKRYSDELIQTIRDIFIELEDRHFSIEINEPNLNNSMRLHISIVSRSDERALPFTLADVKEQAERLVHYLQGLNMGYFLEEVVGFGPSFKEFNIIKSPTDVSQWNDSQQYVMLNLYIDHDETLKVI